MNPVLTVIGSGTLVPSAERSSPCHLLAGGDTLLLLDAGPGAVHGLARHGKPWWSVSHLVLTHFHTDHFADLPHLLFALKWAAPSSRTRPLHVLGPPGLHGRIEALGTAHGEFIANPGFPVVYEEVAREGTWTDGSIAVRFAPARHTDHSVAVRAELDGGTLGYTGDTGPDPALGGFFAGSEVLVSECALVDQATMETHLSPASVATMACAANPGTLVLTHLYPPLDAASVPGLVRAAGYSGRVVCARDGQEFTIGESESCS